MLSNDDALKTAFQLLASTVRDFHLQARPCLGATLKPALYTRGSFTEQLLGFRKFGDFLRAAQTAGYVQLRPTAGGDISVWPASIPIGEFSSSTPTGSAPSILPVSPSRSTTAGVRVRQDLWNAFNSFSAKWVYDPATDVAFKDTDASGTWTGAGNQRPNLLQIPSGRERVVEWMRSFANMQDPETSGQLSVALNGDSGPYHFNNLVRSKDLLRSWSHFHIQQVLAAIGAWAALSGVQPKNVTTMMYSPGRSTINTPPPAPTISVIPQTVQQPATSVFDPTRTSHLIGSPLTNRLEALVDDLIDQLIRLRGLLQVVGSKQS